MEPQSIKPTNKGMVEYQEGPDRSSHEEKAQSVMGT